MIGHRIGPYEVLAKLGEGGMGEVYRARDTKLHRDVAIKILPDAFAADAERVARFTREATSLAALNHPHIAHIHGLEEFGGGRALVMELVEGEDLSQRIARGAVPVDETLAIAKQIADALGAAHAQGLIHRDLKPANIRLRDDGTVKLLDFGLAKPLERMQPGASSMPSLPTITSPTLTRVGVILGTAAYMAPEQAAGRAADRRADIWAFGCVLYEMLTGRRAFARHDLTETITAVMETEPDWSALPPGLSPAITVFLRRCLRKQPKDRVQDIGDVRLALDGAFDAPAAGADADRQRGRALSPRFVATTVALVVASGTLAWMVTPNRPVQPSPARWFSVTPINPPISVGVDSRAIAITPDGSRILYFAGLGAERALYERRLDGLIETRLRTGPQFFELFVSPDSAWVGLDNRTLAKMPVGGGPPVALLQVEPAEIETWGAVGATWGADDTMIFARAGGDRGLWRVPAAGGAPVPVTVPDKARGELAHAWPELLPGGRAVLYTVRSGTRENPFHIWARDLQTGAATALVAGSGVRYAPTGHLVYGLEGHVWTVPFDAHRLEVTGKPVRVVEGVHTASSGRVDVDVSDDGTLIYLTAAVVAPRQLVWVDRQTGSRTPLEAPPRIYTTVKMSPDGLQAAFEISDQDHDIHVWTFTRPGLQRLTTGRALEINPIWTRDGRILFSSDRSGDARLYVQPASGIGEARPLLATRRSPAASDILRDGRLIYQENRPGTGGDLMMSALESSAEPVPFVADPFWQVNARVSPDGTWLAYQSDEVNQFVWEIYVRPFPDITSGKIAVSPGGATLPAWHGNDLFFLVNGDLMSVTISPTAPPTTPRLVAKGPFISYDISSDGRILAIVDGNVSAASSSRSIGVILNWVESLRSTPAHE